MAWKIRLWFRRLLQREVYSWEWIQAKRTRRLPARFIVRPGPISYEDVRVESVTEPAGDPYWGWRFDGWAWRWRTQFSVHPAGWVRK